MSDNDQEMSSGSPGRFYLRTFGCQMNRSDSEWVSGFLEARGWRRVADDSTADLVLLNTCSVRRRPEEKVWGRLAGYRRVKALRPELIVGVLGCMAQIRGRAIRERFPEVDLILGPEKLDRLSEELAAKRGEVRLDPSGDSPPAADRESPLSAWVTVIRGCDNFCSYCVVPYARGREVSRPPGEIIAEVGGLADSGYREVTLLGQNVNSYRGVGSGGEEVDFSALLRLLDPIPGIRRIRFLTSHPKDISPGLIAAMAELEKVCEFLHFPAQSGADRVLARMRRGYTRAEYLEKVRRLRRAVPGIALASDFIVGFPGESEEDSARTRELIAEVGFDQVFAFAYSPRPGTAAAEFPDDVPEEVKASRLQELLNLQRKLSRVKNQSLVGEVREVLVEGKNKKYPDRGEGRTRTGRMVFFPWKEGLTGKLVPVRLERATDLSLFGTIRQ